jgi:competence protein ComEC
MQGMPIWKEAPFLRISLPFITGIVIQYYTGVSDYVWCAFVFAGLLTWLVFSTQKSRTRFLYYHVQGICIQLIFVFAGCILCAYKNPYLSLYKMQGFLRSENLFSVCVTEPAVEKKSSWKTIGVVENIGNPGGNLQPATNLIVYFRKDTSIYVPVPGDRIAFTKMPQRISNFVAGSSFDYERYCALKNIHYQVFLTCEDFSLVNSGNIGSVTRMIHQIQKLTIRHLQTYIADSTACGLALALLIGYKHHLDPYITNAYAQTGVVHVIAISGLHLGIIYSMLALCCKALKNTLSGRCLRAAIVLCGLWLFSLVAGAAPSVLRSAVMFSCIALGECANRRTPLINNLAASAFILLCIEPFWLFDLGFQLSYTALLGIATLSKPLNGLVTFDNRACEMLWTMNAVTISAQLLTLPLLLYNFHQFPNYFLFANLVAIPASTAILLGEILLCLVAFSGVGCVLLGQLLSYMIIYLNHFIVFISRLPYSVAGGLQISLAQAVCLYAFIACSAAWLVREGKYYLPAALFMCILFFVVPLVKIWW